MISLFSLVALSVAMVDVLAVPAWQMNYSAALSEGARLHKPLAVFLAPGKEGWHKLSRDGSVSRETQRLLAAKYISVFVDTETTKGKAVAAAFELSGAVGLVLSDRDGQYQAFRHEGALTQKTLLGALERHANPRRPVQIAEAIQPVIHEPAAPRAAPAYPESPYLFGYTQVPCST
jgi:hypothetical protein